MLAFPVLLTDNHGDVAKTIHPRHVLRCPNCPPPQARAIPYSQIDVFTVLRSALSLRAAMLRAATCASSALEENASVVAARTWLSFAACLTDAGSTKKQRRGGTAEGTLPDGPIWWRRLGFG
jgi:uncharacterized protein (DUF3084 family)